ncbi:MULTISPECIES: hypothetical protein [Actinoalloteichus]|uniref:Uncharacterized protein n=1 Tax=Actinoalloteichus fjordicus TaxID=1612552 RepID=A0AAC9LCI9_9PSEU|nr:MULTISPECIES: hypothetical protein [Actinoalloteichus]APU15091.1 hypothetical protein UA74_15190 [Actinoalloteichus fjordicus]
MNRLLTEHALASMDELVVLFPAHVTRYWARPDIAYLPHRSGAAAVRAGVVEGGGERAHLVPGRDHP